MLTPAKARNTAVRIVNLRIFLGLIAYLFLISCAYQYLIYRLFVLAERLVEAEVELLDIAWHPLWEGDFGLHLQCLAHNRFIEKILRTAIREFAQLKVCCFGKSTTKIV